MIGELLLLFLLIVSCGGTRDQNRPGGVGLDLAALPCCRPAAVIARHRLRALPRGRLQPAGQTGRWLSLGVRRRAWPSQRSQSGTLWGHWMFSRFSCQSRPSTLDAASLSRTAGRTVLASPEAGVWSCMRWFDGFQRGCRTVKDLWLYVPAVFVNMVCS